MTISKGVVINFVIEFLFIMFLVYYKFNIPTVVLSIVMLVVLLGVSAYTGYKAERFPQAHGFFVGLISAFLLVLSLYVTVDMNWELNGIIAIVWSFVGYVGAWIGGKMDMSKVTLRRQQKQQKRELKEN